MPPSARERRFLHDEDAVSEVVGQILTLGIMSALLITSLLGFAIAKDNATERAVSVQGDALLQRVSSTAIQAALFAEANEGSAVAFNGTVDLPSQLEGHDYWVDLDPDEVIISFPAFDGNVSAPLFQAGAGDGITVCDQQPLIGGPLRLRLLPDDDADVPTGASCDGTGTTLALFLEHES